jgi:hypothetical protein
MKMRGCWTVVALVTLVGCGGNKTQEKQDAKPTQEAPKETAAKAPAEPEAPDHCKKALAGLDPKLSQSIKKDFSAFPDADARYTRFERNFLKACTPVAADTLACATPENSPTCAPLRDLVSTAQLKAGWVDAEAAATQPADQRCQGLFDSLVGQMGKAFKGLGAPQQEAFKKHLLAGCVTLKPEELACAEANSEPRACEPFLNVLKVAMTHPDVIDPKELEAFKLKSMQTEVKAMVKGISVGIMAVHAETGKLPGAVGLTPAGDCCKQPDGKCPGAHASWEHKEWKAIGFSSPEATRYRYSLVVKGKGKKATVTIHAEGDPTCKGAPEVWESEGVTGADGALTFAPIKKLP